MGSVQRNRVQDGKASYAPPKTMANKTSNAITNRTKRVLITFFYRTALPCLSTTTRAPDK